MKTNRKNKADERTAIDVALAAGATVKALPATKGKRKDKRNALPPEPKAAKFKKGKAQVVQLDTPTLEEFHAEPEAAKGPIKGSVVAAHWKAKAGKTGVWKQDKLRDALRSAFLREGSSEVSDKEAARIATDHILQENGLDVGRWAGKNPGMLAMNLGNVLRGLLRNDGVVFVYGKKIDA